MRKGLIAFLVAALLPVAAANAWWGGYAPAPGYYWGCDPQTAYLQEYGFLDPFGPSRGDMQRLHRDEWRAANGPAYFGGYSRVYEDPVTKAVRIHCHGSWYRPYYGW